MERVRTLINKLKNQLEEGADPAKMLINAQMLLVELKQCESQGAYTNISVVVPHAAMIEAPSEVKAAEIIPAPPAIPPSQNVIKPDIPQSILEVQEHKDELMEAPAWLYDVVNSLPTFAHQPEKQFAELNTTVAAPEERSINEKLKERRSEVGSMLQDTPIKDLKRAIGINDRYLFINELFRGDDAMYDRSLKTINSYSSLPEAEFWIQRELKLKLSWPEDSSTVKLFDQLVKRRFS